MTRSIITMMLASAALAACQPAANKSEAPASAKPTDAEAAAIVDKVETTFNSGDAKTIMANYRDDAVLFDPVEPEPTADHATAMRWNENFAKMKLSGMQVPNRRIQVLDADTIVSSGIGEFTKSGAGEKVPAKFRYTDVYQRQPDGSWKVVHEHISFPPGPPPPAPAPAG
jgi:ketosteroid isomerase-like protein